MNAEEIARKLGEYNYLKLCRDCEKGAEETFSLEKYWEINKEYFIKRAETYLEVKACLEKN